MTELYRRTAVFSSSRAPRAPVCTQRSSDAIGAVTKLLEAAGLALALSLLQAPRTAAKELAASTRGVDP